MAHNKPYRCPCTVAYKFSSRYEIFINETFFCSPYLAYKFLIPLLALLCSFFDILKRNLIIYAASEKSILIPEYVMSLDGSLFSR